MGVCGCFVCLCFFIIFHVNSQSNPFVLIIPSHLSPSIVCVCVYVCLCVCICVFETAEKKILEPVSRNPSDPNLLATSAQDDQISPNFNATATAAYRQNVLKNVDVFTGKTIV